jgi:hypothetical protein
MQMWNNAPTGNKSVENISLRYLVWVTRRIGISDKSIGQKNSLLFRLEPVTQKIMQILTKFLLYRRLKQKVKAILK